MGMLLKFFGWVFQRFAGAILITVLALATCGVWLYLKDNVDWDVLRQDLLRTINGERTKVSVALADVNLRLARISQEIVAEEERGKQTDKVIAQLKELESTWDRYVGNPAQQKANAEQLAKMTALRKQITEKAKARQTEFTRTTWERDGLEIALGKIESRLRAAEAEQSKVMRYLQRTWNYPLGLGPLRMAAKWWILVTLVIYFAGPTLGKVALYYLVAPVLVRSQPVRLQMAPGAMPDVSASSVSAEIVLEPGERLWVKEKFLQASDEGMRRKTKYLLDWRVPFTCFATGLVELIEMSHSGDESSPRQRLTLSNQADPHSELAVVTLVDGATLILRPTFLAGVVTAGKRRLVIRRRWQLFRWQSWVTLQFRFFEFVGPCRLVVAGKRGVRAERLTEPEGHFVPARRANQDATMGFTPNLEYRPARAETFWGYYRGMNPLFDDLFAGRGIFLCQQIAAAEDGKVTRSFWSGVWSGTMRVFGM